jgi:lysophospholipid acyltransferase (LPLAT)-like uncharacterized protein
VSAASPWWMGPAAGLGAMALRVLGGSWRIERIGDQAEKAEIAAGRAVIYAFWHARMLPLIYQHRGQIAAAMVSRSRDGELIARIIERLGYVTARGSSTRGGSEAALEALEWGRRGYSIALSPDGPRGPALEMKPGLVWLAARSGLRVVPIASASRPTWFLRSWDRYRVPCPFARVWIAYGEPMDPPSSSEGPEARAWSERCEQALNDLSRLASQRAGEGT